MLGPESGLASPRPAFAGVLNPRVDWSRALTRRINRDCSEEVVDRVIGAICQAHGGSGEGLKVAHEWYRDQNDYPGDMQLLFKWNALEKNPNCSDGFAVLCQMTETNGFDALDTCSETEPGFETCQYRVIEVDEPPTAIQRDFPNALSKYSLKGHRDEIARIATDQVHILGRLALSNQLTVIYGPPGIGKSLVTMSLLIDAITNGNLRAEKCYYVDFDTNPSGLLEKVDIAESIGFHVLSDGFLSFNNRLFNEALDELIAEDQAAGTLIVLDTLKKFTSIMDKGQSSFFANKLRRFSKAGGACVALAHVNKKRTAEGKLVHAGTTDIHEDFDCTHLMDEVTVDPDTQTRTVKFTNEKGRGDVAKQASYRYSIAEGLTYSELLDSVVALDGTELSVVQRIHELKADAALIEAISATIRRGIDGKMELVENTSNQTNTSRRAVSSILDKYCGPDPSRHLWKFTVHERGLKKYQLLIDSKMDGGEHR